MRRFFIVSMVLLGGVLGLSGCQRCSGKLSPEAERAMNSGKYSMEPSLQKSETRGAKPIVIGDSAKKEDSGRTETDSVNVEVAEVQEVLAIEHLAVPVRVSNVPEQILRRKAYVSSFNTETLMPNWVAWKLTAEETNGRVQRSSFSFQEDLDVAPRYRVMPSDYSRSGYDRGHMCPAGDNRWDSRAMEESFLMTNICPQLHSLNSGAWNNLEIQCRDWAREYGEIYIVCGPIVSKNNNRKIGRKRRITVPSAFFKVILCMKGTPKAIGFVFRNEESHRSKSDYMNTVDDVERITGLNFFAALPDSIEDRVEATANLEDW
ncbi:MAG: DNA/RNA non-specific endonuclease [Prevotella sp.]|jgi:endonuclease G